MAQGQDLEKSMEASETSLSAKDLELYAGPLDAYQNMTSRASKSNEAHDLYEKIQKLAGEYHTGSTTDPLVNGTLSRLLDGYPYTPQSLPPTAHHSAMNLHGQKAWVELKQQISEIDAYAKEQASGNDQAKTLQQSLHRISQVLEEAVEYARSNQIDLKDDLTKLLRMVCKSMRITSGSFSLSVFRNCLSLICNLCACGEGVSKLVLDHQLIQGLLYPLSSANASTYLKVQILNAFNTCINDPLVVQHILDESLYHRFILPLLQDSKLPAETMELVGIIVEKIGFFESCATIRRVSLNLGVENVDTTSLDGHNQLVKTLLTTGRYLLFHNILQVVTEALASTGQESLFAFYMVLWQTKQGLQYLSNELEKPALGKSHLFEAWTESQGDGGIFGWLREEKLRGSPGILDYRQGWISDNKYSRNQDDLTYEISTSSFVPVSGAQYTLEEFVTTLIYQVYAVRLVSQLIAHSDLKGKRPVLIGKEDYLQANLLIKLMHDMCTFNIGKQAVASVVSFLGALPILISYSSSNAQAKRLVTAVFSYYHLLEVKLSPADIDRLRITYQQEAEDDAVYYTILKYHKHNDLGVLIDILANTERRDFSKESVVDKIAYCVRILLKHSYTGSDPLGILSAQLNIVGSTQEDPILVYLLRIVESAIEALGEMNKISPLYPDALEDEATLVEKMASMSWSDPQSYIIERIRKKTKWLELSRLTLELMFSIIYHTGDGLIVSVTLAEPGESSAEELSLDITRDDHLLNECFKQVLKLLYTLDQLDIQNLKPNEQSMVVNSYGLYLLGENLEVMYRFFDMVNTVVPDGESGPFRCKIPTGLIGNKVVQYLLDGLHDAPQHFLSGLKLLGRLLPPPYVPKPHHPGSLKDWVYNDNCLRLYWTNQLLPFKDDLEECLRTLIFTSSKEVHVALRSLLVQMVELDIGDMGIARGIFKLIVNQLYEELEAFSRVLHAVEYQATKQSTGNGNSCLWQQSSFEEQFMVSRISRLLCLLLALVRIPCGHFYLLDIFECNIRDGLDQTVGMFFDIVDLLGPDHFVSDLASKLIYLLSNHWEQFDRRIPIDALNNHKAEVDAQSTQLSEFISKLLDCGSTRALSMLSNLSRSVIGTLTILSNPEFCYSIHANMNHSMKELSQGDRQPFVLERLCRILGLSKLLYDQWMNHVTASPTHNDIKISLFANLLGPFKTCVELGQDCLTVLASDDGEFCETSRELLHWYLEVAQSLQQEGDSSQHRFDEPFDGIESCFLGLERIFQIRKRTLNEFLKSRELRTLPIERDDHISTDDFEEIFYFSNEVRDFKSYALRMFPGFSTRKRIKVYDEQSDEEGDPVIIPFEPHNVSSLTRDELHRKNLGGGKAYQSNEFRDTYGVRKANAARLPSVHVDDFHKKPQPEALSQPNPNPNPNPNHLATSHLPPESFNTPTRHGRPESSSQPSQRGRANPSNARAHSGNRQWPVEPPQYAMVGPPLNDFEVNRRGAFQQFPNGFPVATPYYNPHYYPPNQGFYERPFFPNGPSQFFDSSQLPRPRLPPNRMQMEQMEPRGAM
ncbi:hypothetical protein K493DRAFT_406793 [Basidiobolus meristosporus CBS 931.73]|uniref:Uncharacterized protein n=1 Tax=Basidiobolus meristosporus CBS 931.73 TaxID=1314790 RepID=A0A1Y1YIY8_9FUNG|nr:hypothetical protein K493DRAFT_406793 [Basidiobolus meristosporus CBS 931.73]|eukprot:ORX97823.1 hypothetical protein K493DRAFT_406793 [Basidiobolus meristosporus CBS 931.73]